jgi:hypothetical protein
MLPPNAGAGQRMEGRQGTRYVSTQRVAQYVTWASFETESGSQVRCRGRRTRPWGDQVLISDSDWRSGIPFLLPTRTRPRLAPANPYPLTPLTRRSPLRVFPHGLLKAPCHTRSAFPQPVRAPTTYLVPSILTMSRIQTESSSLPHRLRPRFALPITPRLPSQSSPALPRPAPSAIRSRYAGPSNRNTLPFRTSATNHALRADSRSNGRPGDSRTPNKHPLFRSCHELLPHVQPASPSPANRNHPPSRPRFRTAPLSVSRVIPNHAPVRDPFAFHPSRPYPWRAPSRLQPR